MLTFHETTGKDFFVAKPVPMYSKSMNSSREVMGDFHAMSLTAAACHVATVLMSIIDGTGHVTSRHLLADDAEL